VEVRRQRRLLYLHVAQVPEAAGTLFKMERTKLARKDGIQTTYNNGCKVHCTSRRRGCREAEPGARLHEWRRSADDKRAGSWIWRTHALGSEHSREAPGHLHGHVSLLRNLTEPHQRPHAPCRIGKHASIPVDPRYLISFTAAAFSPQSLPTPPIHASRPPFDSTAGV
jgi:hypothetical protein